MISLMLAFYFNVCVCSFSLSPYHVCDFSPYLYLFCAHVLYVFYVTVDGSASAG